MAQQNRRGSNRGRTTAVKEENEERGSGIMPYVMGGLAGVAVGLLGSLLVDKAVEHIEAREAQKVGSHRDGRCESNTCAVCLDEAAPTFRTNCCGHLLHGKCLQDMKKNAPYSRCPYCRSSAWLG